MPGTTWDTAEAISGQTGSISGTSTGSNYWYWVFTGEEGLTYDFTISGGASGHLMIGGTGEYDPTAKTFQIPDYYGGSVRLTGAGTTPVHIRVEYSSGPFTITWAPVLNGTPQTAQPFGGESGSLDCSTVNGWYLFTPEPGRLYTFTSTAYMNLYKDGTWDGSYDYLSRYYETLVWGEGQRYLNSGTGGTVSWTSVVDPDPSPNDTWQTAVPIDGTAAGSIAYEDSHHDGAEWFLLNAVVGSFYLFHCDEPDGYYELYAASVDGQSPEYLQYGYEPNAPLGVNAEAEQYYVVVYPSSRGATGTLSWTIEGAVDPPPYVVANDLQENAVVIDGSKSGSVAYDNTGATGVDVGPTTVWGADVRSIWFKFTTTGTVSVTATATPSVPDDYAKPSTWLVDANGTAFGNNSNGSSGNDSYGPSYTGLVPPNTDVYVRISFPQGNQGLWDDKGTLAWTVTPVPDNALPAHPVDLTPNQRVPLDFPEGGGTRWFTYTAAASGPFMAVLGDATLNPVGAAPDWTGATAVTMRVYSGDGTQYYGATNYRSTADPTAKFIHAVRAGEQLQIAVINTAGTPVLLRWGTPTQADPATFGEWQDTAAATWNNSTWFSYNDGYAFLPDGVKWQREFGSQFGCQTQAMEYQGPSPLSGNPYQGPPDASDIPRLREEVDSGKGWWQAGEAISRNQDPHAGAAGSEARDPNPGYVQSDIATSRSVGYSASVQQGPYYWPIGAVSDNHIDGGTFAENAVESHYFVYAFGFDEADEQSPFYLCRPVHDSNVWTGTSATFDQWMGARTVEWSDGSAGGPVEKAIFMTYGVTWSNLITDGWIGGVTQDYGGTSVDLHDVSALGPVEAEGGWVPPATFDPFPIVKSIPTSAGKGSVSVDQTAMERTTLPFIPGNPYRIAGLTAQQATGDLDASVCADTRLAFYYATALVSVEFWSMMRFPDQYRIGEWSEDGVFPPLDAPDRSDLGLSASGLAAVPEEPIVHFTGSH